MKALFMINLYVKFNVHFSYAKQVIVLKVADRRTNGRTDSPGDEIGIRQSFGRSLKRDCPRLNLFKNRWFYFGFLI